MRFLPAAICAAAIAFIGPTPAGAEKLIFATAVPAGTPMTERVFKPWAAHINAAGAGAVEIDLRDGISIANLNNYFDRVTNDVVQIAFGMQNTVGGRFPLSAAAGLPYVGDRSEPASVAFWRLYKSGLLDAEYKDLVPLMLGIVPPSRLHMAKPLKSLDSVAGLKLIVTGKERSDVVMRLGFTPVTASSSEMYTMLQRHVADGAAVSWSAFETFKLAEVTSYHVDAPLGGSTAIVFMTKKRYDALSSAGRKAIDDNSGEKQTRLFGATWDHNADENRAKTQAMPGQLMAELDPATAEKWKRTAEPVLEEWAAAHPNGAAVLAKYRELLAEAEATIR